MTYEEYMDTIAKSNREDWIYNDDFGLYTFKPDIRITIISDKEDAEDFYEDWIENFIDKGAKKARFFLCFNGNKIDVFYTAAVDGYRMYIPYTDLMQEQGRSITDRKYNIGKILNIPHCNVIDDYDNYLKQAQIKIIG